MKKGFVISWYYPPGNSSEGLVTFKLLKNSEYTFDVWTRSDQHQSLWDRKSNEDKLTAENVTILKGECEDYSEWIEAGLQYFLEHRDEYDFIMSRSMPVECHELAIRIKKLVPDIKWIASFGDPIVNTPYIDELTMGNQENPYTVQKYIEREGLSRFRAFRVMVSLTRLAKQFVWNKEKKVGDDLADYFKRINEATLDGSDVVVFNNQYQFKHAFQDEALKKYKEKGVILHHSYDEELYPTIKEKKKDDVIRFVYVGHLDHNRNAKPILKALNKLKQRDPNINKKVQFVFYGRLDSGDKVYVVDHDLVDLVKIKKDIGYLESLKIIKEADWAILIDANFTKLVDECIYLPAKLMDYIGARTNVFSVSHLKGAGADIIRKVGGGKVVTHNADDVYLYLSKIIYQDYKPRPYDEKEANKFSSVEISKKLDKIIRRMVKE